jgi:hypothetical protein
MKTEKAALFKYRMGNVLKGSDLMARKIVLQESILNILGLASLDENIGKMHYNNVFHAFKKAYESKPTYFPGLCFSDSVGEPHSSRIEDVLSSLGTWKVVSVENPRYEYLQINREVIKETAKAIEKDYGDEILADYRELAKIFAKEILSRENTFGGKE